MYKVKDFLKESVTDTFKYGARNKNTIEIISDTFEWARLDSDAWVLGWSNRYTGSHWSLMPLDQLTPNGKLILKLQGNYIKQ